MTNTAFSSKPIGKPSTTILLVDDHVSGAQTLQMLLALEGYEVILASTGNEALKLFTKHKPAIVLLDISLPDTDGYSVARAIRKSDHSTRTTIIAVTGWGKEQDEQRALEAGCDHHCSKPVCFDELASLLYKLHHAQAAVGA